MDNVVVAALYHFAKFPDYKSFREPILNLMLAQEVRGTLLLAHEGINGTIAGSRSGIDEVLACIRADGRFAQLETKESNVAINPFYRTKVKLKKEIVTMGIDNIDPGQIVGTYVDSARWNELISDPDVTVVDTRNRYEVQIGTFKNAINPETSTFREFPQFVAKSLDPRRNRKVAMFCTGGIRCEKSSAYLKQQGFDEVYHLKGGILKYLEDIPAKKSLWQGECFVFDNRVTVDHDLKKGSYDQCHACRMPISEQDKESENYQKGVSCPHCFHSLSREKAKRYAERERQVELAKKRGEVHIGQPVETIISARKKSKIQFKNTQRNRDKDAASRD